MSDPYTDALLDRIRTLERLVKTHQVRTWRARQSRDNWMQRARNAEGALRTATLGSPYMRRRVRDLEDQLLRLWQENERKEIAA